MNKIKQIGIASLLLFILSACSMVPDGLIVDENAQLTDFSVARADTSNTKGQLVRWGGIIAKIENKPEQSIVEVVHFPLKSSTRPRQKNATQGRFKIYFQGLLDPMLYKEGKSVTVLGNIGDFEQGTIGEHEYLYPVVNASYVHLWKDIKRVDVRVNHNPHWYSPMYWHYGYPRFHSTAVIRSSSSNAKQSAGQSSSQSSNQNYKKITK